MKTSLNIRCRFSEKWVPTYNPQLAARLGRIISETRDKTCWKVLWDGAKSAQTYHKSFIDIVEQQTTPI